MSAHWNARHQAVGSSEQYTTIHDFSGFDKELYRLHYPAKGDKELAIRIMELLRQAGGSPTLDEKRGLDHGAWIPLSLMYPDASIPVVQIAVEPAHDAAYHFQLGRTLRVLRDEGILIMGSGSLSHNLGEVFRGSYAETPEWVSSFCKWLYTCLDTGDTEQLLAWKEYAPHALRNHPTDEHFLPFFFALGAAMMPLQYTTAHQEMRFDVLATDMITFQ